MRKVWIILCVLILIVVVVAFLLIQDKSPQNIQSQSYVPEQPHFGAARVPPFVADTLEICSFNIQFLGSFKKRDDEALADILKPYDIVAIQELVAPPYDGAFPDGEPYSGDAEAAEFFDAMQALGFEFLLSEEDTGTGEENRKNSTATEWFVTFYNPHAVRPAADLPCGFLAQDRSDHTDFERVPYAFPFRSVNGTLDFVLISVHLQPGDRLVDRQRRQQELSAISEWIHLNDEIEKDFIILGDMNLYDAEEVTAVTPDGYLSLNDECRPTNSLAVKDRGNPYDHVMVHTTFTSEVDTAFDLAVVNLVELMRSHWTASSPYPGEPYDHNLFRQYYSDHFPVVFRLITPTADDDGPHL